MSIKMITHNGETKSMADWARACKTNQVSFGFWVNQYGIARALELAAMTQAKRREWRKAQKEANGEFNAWDSELPEKDPDLEWKNRIAGWIRMGMSKEEMIIKARHSDAITTTD